MLAFINGLSEMGIVARFRAEEDVVWRKKMCAYVYTQLVHKIAE